MEEQKEKKEGGINYGVLIAIAITASIFIGIKIYTKHLEKQNMEALTRIMEENPDFLNNILSGSCSKSEVTWKTFSNEVLSFEYPSNYSVRKDVSDDMVQLYCEAGDNDDYALINITYIGNLDTKSLSASEKKQRCINGIKEVQKSLKEEFEATFTSINNDEIGELKGYRTTFEGNLYGLYEIQGDVFMCFYKDKTVAVLSQMEKDKPVEIVNRIIESIKVK